MNRLRCTALALALAAAMPAAAAPSYEVSYIRTPENAERTNLLNAHSVVAADFNGDGRMDLASHLNTGTYYSDSDYFIRVLYQNAAGSLVEGPRVRTHWEGPGGYGYASNLLSAGDFDGDGDAELVVAEQGDHSDDFELILLERQADGQFVEARRLAIPRMAAPLARIQTARVDADGYLDLVLTLATGQGSAVMTWHGRGDLSFRSPTWVASYSGRPTLVDVDGDGRLDLLGRLPYFSDGFSVSWGDGSPQHFQMASAYPDTAISSDAGGALTEAGQFDGDARQEVAAMYIDRTQIGNDLYFHHRLAIYDVKADRTLVQKQVYSPTLEGAYYLPDLVRADLDADGDQDLVLSFNGQLELALQNSTGFEFMPLPITDEFYLGALVQSESVVVADFTADGCVDIGIAFEYTYSIYRRSDCPTSAPSISRPLRPALPAPRPAPAPDHRDGPRRDTHVR